MVNSAIAEHQRSCLLEDAIHNDNWGIVKIKNKSR